MDGHWLSEAVHDSNQSWPHRSPAREEPSIERHSSKLPTLYVTSAQRVAIACSGAFLPVRISPDLAIAIVLGSQLLVLSSPKVVWCTIASVGHPAVYLFGQSGIEVEKGIWHITHKPSRPLISARQVTSEVASVAVEDDKDVWALASNSIHQPAFGAPALAIYRTDPVFLRDETFELFRASIPSTVNRVMSDERYFRRRTSSWTNVGIRGPSPPQQPPDPPIRLSPFGVWTTGEIRHVFSRSSAHFCRVEASLENGC